MILQPHQLPDKEIAFHTPINAVVVLNHRKLEGPKEYGYAIAADALYKMLTREEKAIYKLHCEGNRYFLRARAKDDG